MLVLSAILTIFVYGMIAAMLGTILPNLSTRFKLTPKQNGNIAMAQAFGLILASLSAGPFIDNVGQKSGLVLGLALIAIALFALPKSTGYRSVAIYLFILGLGGGTIVTGANTLISDYSGDNRAVVMNLFNIFFGLGGLATPFLSANLLKKNAYRLCYLTAIMTVGTLMATFAAGIPGPTGERSFQVSQMDQLTSNPSLYLLSLLLFLYVTCEVGVWNWLPRHLIAQGIPESKALNILSLGFALGLLLGRLASAAVLTKFTPEAVTLGASILMIFATYVALQTKQATISWVAVFIAGLAMAPVFPTVLGMVGNRFPVATGTAMGIVITAGWIGLAISSRIIGAIAGEDPKKLKKALLILPAASLVMAVACLGL